MIHHVAVFRFNDGVSQETINDIDLHLATLPTIIPRIVSFASGRNVGVTDGSWDYGVSAVFATPEDYLTYATNPQHVDMVKNVVGPHVKEAARIQFESSRH